MSSRLQWTMPLRRFQVLAPIACAVIVALAPRVVLGTTKSVCDGGTLEANCSPSEEGHFYFCSDKYVWEWRSDKSLVIPRNLSDSLCVTMEAAVVPGLESDRILVLGGCDASYENITGASCSSITSRAYGYEVDSGEFTTSKNMPHPRYRFAVANDSQYIYTFGGRGVNDELVCDLDYLNVVTGVWGTVEGGSWDNGYCSSDLGSFQGDDGTIYLVGGYNQEITAAYGVVNRVTVTKDDAGVPVSATYTLDDTKMEFARGDLSCLRPPGSAYAYCIGGFAPPGSSPTGDWKPLSSTEKYLLPTSGDTSGGGTTYASGGGSGTWSRAAYMAKPRGDFAIAFINGRITVIGGEDFTGAIQDVEWYSPEEDCWTDSGKLFDIPTDRFRYCGAAVPADDRVYLFGGQGQVVYRYDSDGSYLLTDEVLWYQETLIDDGNSAAGAGPGAAAAVVAAAVALWVAGCGGAWR